MTKQNMKTIICLIIGAGIGELIYRACNMLCDNDKSLGNVYLVLSTVMLFIAVTWLIIKIRRNHVAVKDTKVFPFIIIASVFMIIFVVLSLLEFTIEIFSGKVVFAIVCICVMFVIIVILGVCYKLVKHNM